MTHNQARMDKQLLEQNADDHHSEPEGKVPSWFARDSLTETTPDRFSQPKMIVETPGAEAYEVYKRRLDERFQHAQQLYDSPRDGMRPTLPMSDIHGRRRLYKQEEQSLAGARPPQQKVPLGRIVGLGLLAAVVGTASGFGFANRDRLVNFIDTTFASSQVAFAKAIPNLGSGKRNETVINKKSVAIASLDVNDVKGTLNSMIPLMLSAQPAEGGDAVALKIMGLPPEAYLTAGTETTQGNWLLKPADIAGVKLVVPQSSTSQFDVEVAAVEEHTGVLAAPIKAMNVQLDAASIIAAAPAIATRTGDGKSELASTNVAATIAPASTTPDTALVQTAASPIPTPAPEAVALISKGDGLLNSGDIASARQFYLRADALGDAKGAYGVGRTYDPAVFAALNVQGLKPDAAKAAAWYQKAIDGGVGAAQNALSAVQAALP
jgi:hypothetical protein